jgi:hypothetical protein
MEMKKRFTDRKWHHVISLLGWMCRPGCSGCGQLDMKVPVGKIEGNQFTGVRYPFNIVAPSNWQMATEYPKFIVDLGFEKGGLEESQIFVFNPETQSNLQIDLSPSRKARRTFFSPYKRERTKAFLGIILSH